MASSTGPTLSTPSRAWCPKRTPRRTPDSISCASDWNKTFRSTSGTCARSATPTRTATSIWTSGSTLWTTSSRTCALTNLFPIGTKRYTNCSSAARSSMVHFITRLLFISESLLTNSTYFFCYDYEFLR